MTVDYLNDRDVDAALDGELRGLLSTCFTKPGDDCFRERRYWRELPQHRWLIREAGRLVAHLAVHDKILGTTEGDLAIGGVAEVCVHPDYRGRGLVRQLLAASDAWLAARGVPFGMLFGDARVYGSSGYVRITNPLRHRGWPDGDWRTESNEAAMVKPFGRRPWPLGPIDLRGPIF